MKQSRPVPSHARNTPRDTGVLSRRRFLRETTAAAAGLALGAWAPLAEAARRNRRLPNPNKSGIQHFVVVMLENRSFDHFLGWLPGANGRQAGLTYTDRAGAAHATYPLTGDYQGCGHPDPDHSYEGGRVEYNNGACDGWLRAADNDLYAIGYYVRDDLSFLGAAAPAWTTCDQYFTAIMAPTYPNRVYQHAAQTDRLENSLLPISSLPTIWDRLEDHGLEGRYYFSDLPFLAMWGARYVSIARLIPEFYADCAAGTLPEVSFVEPRFLGAPLGLSEDDHPFSDIRNGEAFLNRVYEAVTASPAWRNTVLIITFDEWGGFFDHVAPAVAPIPPADAALGSDGLRGFRVPTVVVSPWSPPATVAHGLYDHTSMLKMIEWRWHLRPLTVRDAAANNLAEVLDFSRRNLAPPQFPVPSGPFGKPCLQFPAPAAAEELQALAYAADLGFPVPE